MSLSLLTDNLVDEFFLHLLGSGVSSKSLKHYKSDLSHFSGWMFFKVRSWGGLVESFSELVPFLSSNIAKQYLEFLVLNTASTKTVNRRLSTLRHLARFLIKSQILNSDFMQGISNISLASLQPLSFHPILGDFQRRLEAEKVSQNTIKNYLSDIRQFFSWLQSQETVSRI
ncbi:MAG: site-specific integrase [Patescibacteria group bacterium]